MITLLACYILWVMDGCDPFVPFISDMDTNPASSPYFTIGFTLSGLLLSVIAWKMNNIRAEWIELNSMGTRAKVLNTFSAILGFTSGLFIVWIAYTPWDENLALHLLQARIIFASSIAWAILSTMLASEMQTRDIRFAQVFRPRRHWTVFTVVCCILMALNVVRFIGVGDVASMELNHLESYIEMVEVCTQLSINEMSLAALFEWSMVIGLLGVLETGIREIPLFSSDESK